MSDSNQKSEEVYNIYDHNHVRGNLLKIYDKFKNGFVDRKEYLRLRNSILDKAAAHYSKDGKMSKETAKAALLDIVNLKIDDPKNVQETLEKVLFAIRQMAPKISAVVQREEDLKHYFEMVSKNIDGTDRLALDVKRLENDLELQHQAFKLAIKALEDHRKITFMDVVKCYYKRFLSFLKMS